MIALVRFDSMEGWASAAADSALRAVAGALARGVRPALCLAGGSTPEPAYAELAGRLVALAPARPVLLVVGDERLAPRSEGERNEAMIRRAFAPALAAGAAELLGWNAAIGTRACLDSMEVALRALVAERAAAGERSPFDLALLGLGADGHTAGVFSVTGDSIGTTGRLVVESRAPVPPRERASLNLAFLARSRATIFLAKATGKAEAIAGLMDSDPGYPAVRAASASGPSSIYALY